jgi:hypothetical protein
MSRVVIAVVTAALVVGAALALIVLPTSHSATAPDSASAASALLPFGGCPAARVHRGSLPAAARRAGIPASLPWVKDADAGITGTLVYYGAVPFRGMPSAVIGVQGRAGANLSTKILWWVRGRGSPSLTIVGRRRDAPGSFRQTVAGPIPAGENTVFPSIVTVPLEGCWTLDVRSGRTSGSVTFQSIPILAEELSSR